MRTILLFILALSLLGPAACVKKDPKCKKEHRKARKKGTSGWQY